MEIANISRLIFLVRGQRVMMDADLAALYRVSTGRLNEQVKRNESRFPEDFRFRLSLKEHENLISHFAISSPMWGGRRTPPFVFTQEGVAMLSSVLRSERAVEVNIAIMRAFVRLRQALAANRDLAVRMEKAERALGAHEAELGEHATQIQEVFAAIRKMMEPLPMERRKIGFAPKEDMRRYSSPI